MILSILNLHTKLTSTLTDAPTRVKAHLTFLSLEGLVAKTNKKLTNVVMHRSFILNYLLISSQIIKTSETSPTTAEAMTAWGKAMGKTIVHCKDTPGFIVNRVFVPYLLSCIKLLDEGTVVIGFILGHTIQSGILFFKL